MSAKKRSFPIKTIMTIVFSAALLTAAGWLVLNRQYVTDQVSVWAYTAPPEVEAIDERIAFTDKGTFYFYASRPEVADAESFNQNCPRRETGSPILGCYSLRQIYIYNITNDELDGIEEITAAHEMLHAVWERLGTGEQERIGALLEKAYRAVGDDALKERIDYYSRTQPGEFHNELHSILGTEIPELGDELEAYYSQYFDDRQIVLGLHSQYSEVFRSLEVVSESLLAQLAELGASIESLTEQYSVDSAQLSSDIQAFNQRAENNQFDSIAQFNRERSALIARTTQLNSKRTEINADIATYNGYYQSYQDVASRIEFLNKSIDSINALEPTPTL